jgi:hypothetical protein
VVDVDHPQRLAPPVDQRTPVAGVGQLQLLVDLDLVAVGPLVDAEGVAVVGLVDGLLNRLVARVDVDRRGPSGPGDRQRCDDDRNEKERAETGAGTHRST